MNDLFKSGSADNSVVSVLGRQFSNNKSRREFYLAELEKKLNDADFKRLGGFPIASDEAILALSDPPYYTACPNPFIAEFLSSKNNEEDGVPYVREPFVSDVSEGRSGLFYDAHSYHTKVPHKAIMRFILHYTNPGDVVLDSFCGTGMTGVAAQLCGNRDIVESLGYRVDQAGVIYENLIDDGRQVWREFSKIGERFAILNDLSPAASFISANFNIPTDVAFFKEEAESVLRDVESQLGWMYETKHSDGHSLGRVNYIIWSDVYGCPHCSHDLVFWDVAIDVTQGKIKEKFDCFNCSAELRKKDLERLWSMETDPVLCKTVRRRRQVPVSINYSLGSKRYDKRPEASDLELIAKIASLPVEGNIPLAKLPDGFNTRQPKESHDIEYVHQFYTRRSLHILAALRKRAVASHFPREISFLINSYDLTHSTLMSRVIFKGGGKKPVLTGYQSGTLYVSSLPVEKNIIEGLRKQKLGVIVESLQHVRSAQFVSTGSAASLNIPDGSLDYVFIDPPFGGNIMYSELNFLSESWLGVHTNNKLEAIENKIQDKDLTSYRALMTSAFAEAFRVLKPGRWMTVEFSNTQASVWNSIQTALQEAGFVVANVSALDKKQGSFKAVTTTTAVKQDLVISAYKPNGGLEARFVKAGGSEDSVWDFVRTHLGYLPTVKVKAGDLEFIAERDPRIIFDRMIAWFVRHNFPVPMSTHEFQAGLAQRFVERDGMVFLPDQVAEYDKRRLQVAIAPQMEMFVSDERSAIDWLSDFLKRRPSTYQELSPEFMGQLGAGWKKHEAKPELAALLEDNFLKYDGTGEVPSQIHSYLSTNHKDLRGLEKNSPALVAKAKDRWYVPDPNKAQDLEKKREKALLKEFDAYRSFTGRKIKESRLEVLRAGFRAAWAAKDYKTIIGIANKLPEETLQEDEKLLTLYDLALTRTEDGI
ncbi:site-specific DNA-methyltransferase [Stenotrophomonas maltophilia]|uniref:DNA methyltransferase n=1 Tax=Stenotrophomonas maltophilia TaxID=40324 RepID=UPI0020979A8D|nr:DNA methyltransferase [Stenotrophomonas maltophilia]MCO7477899.1 site-specific DNA-methyltransferase [Stenotrophomonas maltophilia]